MSDPTRLYQDVLMRHARRPRHRGALPPPALGGEAVNALCGDRAIVSLAVDGDRVDAAGFEGEGCAISVAASSLLAEAVLGRTIAEARALTAAVRAAITGDPGEAALEGELAALGTVREFPARHRCATLVCEALDAALGGT